MGHLWKVGPATVAEVVEALNRRSKRSLAYTTLMTILVRLHEKGFVARTRERRHFRYAAVFPEDALRGEIGRRELQRLIDRHGAGTLAGFAADLVGPDAELAGRLRAIADQEDA
jgi:BlaI family transcriptional regulator, penicillinase repressor